MKAVFAGGGTGGHLMAGISTAQEMHKRFHNGKMIFLGTDKDFEKKCVTQNGFEFFKIRSKKWEKSFTGIFSFMWITCVAVIESLLLMKRLNPDIVIGLGGYASFAPIIAAKLLSIPSVLLEQNVIPGKANRFLAKWVDEVYCHWHSSLLWFHSAENIRVTGTPIRKDILSCQRHHSLERFGLSPSKKTILVTGGSQGALAINEVVLKCLPYLEPFSEEIQIIHCTGEYGYKQAKLLYKQTKIDSFVCSFLDDMAAAFSVADIIICRAGATTIAELTAVGIPAILIPYPYAADNHQYWNAAEVERSGAGYLLQQIDLTPERIIELITDLLYNTEKYERMKMFSKEMGMPNAAAHVAESICRVLRYKGAQLALTIR